MELESWDNWGADQTEFGIKTSNANSVATHLHQNMQSKISIILVSIIKIPLFFPGIYKIIIIKKKCII